MKSKEHKHYRKDKECLNCGFPVELKFCSNCGQENVELKEPFWLLFAEGFSDFFHFDSKFTRSIIPLFIKPGFLSLEYNKGRRARFIHPLRLYFFISVVMLLISGYLFNKMHLDISKFINIQEGPNQAKKNFSIAFNKIEKEKLDTVTKETKIKQLEKIYNNKIYEFKKDSTLIAGRIILQEKSNQFVRQKLSQLKSNRDTTLLSDSIKLYNLLLEKGKKDAESFNTELKNLIKNGPAQFLLGGRQKEIKSFFDKEGPIYKGLEEFLTHYLKIFLILLLPIFALFLKVLYFKKNIYYQEHLITMLHLQSFIILFFSIILFIPSIWPNTSIIVLTTGSLITLVYIFFTLKTVYQQKITKTLIKTLLLVLFISFATVIFGGIFISLVFFEKISTWLTT